MPKGRTRRCHCCGEKMPHTCVWLCEACQERGMGRRMMPNGLDLFDILQVAKALETAGSSPIMGMSLDDVAALARCYKAPYNTYGKLKAYVEAVKRLPPREFERSKNEEV